MAKGTIPASRPIFRCCGYTVGLKMYKVYARCFRVLNPSTFGSVKYYGQISNGLPPSYQYDMMVVITLLHTGAYSQTRNEQYMSGPGQNAAWELEKKCMPS